MILQELWVKSSCDCVTGTVREHRKRGKSTVGNRCPRTGEEIADPEDSVLAVVKWRMCELAIAL